MTTQLAPDAPQTFYYADGQRIPIAPSQTFIAVRPDRASSMNASTDVHQLASNLVENDPTSEVFELPQYNLAVIRVNDSRSASPAFASAHSIASFVTAQPEMTLGPSVYEVANAGTEEGLVIVGEILVKFKPGIAAADRDRLFHENHITVLQADYPEPDSYLVGVQNPEDTITIANTLHESQLTEYAQPNFVRLTQRPSARGFSSGLSNGASVLAPPLKVESQKTQAKAATKRAKSSPTLDTPSLQATINDPGFSSQWGLQKIKAPDAWNITMGSPNITIAVIDEGCDLQHEDIEYKLPGYDAVTRSDNPSAQRRDGHGTSCAGVVAAKANNGLGGAGVAPNCKILPIRIAYGNGRGWVTSDAMIADGIRTAVNRGADVLSNSWGGGAPSTAITSAFQYAQTNGRGGKGCAIAIATANSDLNQVAYPANLSPTIPGLLAVGASNEWDQRKSKSSLDGENWWGSNYGPEVDVVAPGVHIYTTDITGAAGYTGTNYIPNFNGTSSATPHVAGLMGLILSADPNLRAWEVEDIIHLSADELGTAGRDPEYGYGRINCLKALEMMRPIWYDLNAQPEFIGAGRECFMRVSFRIFNPSLNTVRLDSVTLTSHTDDWSTEIDRFEYRPNPGNMLDPMMNQDVKFNTLLLKANGSESQGWSYRWSINWTYTFWRPGSARTAMNVQPSQIAMNEANGTKVNGQVIRGGNAGAGTKEAVNHTPTPVVNNQTEVTNSDGLGDTLTIDRQSKTITIVIR
ncbi:MAG: hypothetical protein B0A82_22835 [Alkalinema sp. CACIAM 70d]|nr:MAG: hypothetical protein B0A82_22835 [Alkalinema sp. CACIAM 70d]